MLINTITELRAFVPINKNVDYANIEPYIEQATVKYIIPEISLDEYDVLDAIYNSDPSLFTPEQAEAVRYLQTAIAYYALYLSAPFMNVMVSNMGIQEQRSQEGTSQSSSQWRYTEFRNSCLSNADVAIDQCLAYMEANKLSFPDWLGSDAYTISKSTFISSAADYPFGCISNSRRTFMRVKPHIVQAQEKYILPTLGDDLYNQLESEYQAGNLSPANAVLYTKVVHALAHLTLADAIPHLTLNINATGIVVTIDQDANKVNSTASREFVEKMQRSHDDNAKMFHLTLQKFLYQNIDDYPLFIASPFYSEELHRRYSPGWFSNEGDAFDGYSRNAYRNDFSV